MAAVGADLSSQELLPLAGRFVGARAGAVWVQSAQAEVRDDGDEPYVLLSLSLGPPPAGVTTWSTNDMFALRQEVRRRLADTGVRGVVVSYVGGAAPDEEQDSGAGGKGSAAERRSGCPAGSVPPVTVVRHLPAADAELEPGQDQGHVS